MEVSCKPERRRGLTHIISGAREAKIATSHFHSSTAQPTSVTPSPTNTWEARHFGFTFCSRDITDTTIRKQKKNGRNLSGKKKKTELSICLHTRCKYEVKISDRNSQIEQGIAALLVVLNTTYLMHRKRFVVISLDW